MLCASVWLKRSDTQRVMPVNNGNKHWKRAGLGGIERRKKNKEGLNMNLKRLQLF